MLRSTNTKSKQKGNSNNSSHPSSRLWASLFLRLTRPSPTFLPTHRLFSLPAMPPLPSGFFKAFLTPYLYLSFLLTFSSPLSFLSGLAVIEACFKSWTPGHNNEILFPQCSSFSSLNLWVLWTYELFTTTWRTYPHFHWTMLSSIFPPR